MGPISSIGFASSIFRLIQQIGTVMERTRDLYILERLIFSILVLLDSRNLLFGEDSLWSDTICIDQHYFSVYREHSSEELLANRETNLVSVQGFAMSSSTMYNQLFSMLDERCVKEELQRQTRSAIDSSRLLVSPTSTRRRRSLFLESTITTHLRDKKEALVRARMMADILRTHLVSRTLLGEYRLPMADYKDTSGNVFQSLVQAMKDMTSVLSNAAGAKTTGCHTLSTNPVEASVMQIPCQFILSDAGGGTVDDVTFDVKLLQPLCIEKCTEVICGPSEASLVEKLFLAMPSGESMISPVWGNAQEVGSNAEREKLHSWRSVMHAWRVLKAAQILVNFAVPIEHTIHQEDESSIPTRADQELPLNVCLDELKVLDQPVTFPLSSKRLAQLAENGVNRVRLRLLKLRSQSPTRRRSGLGSVGFRRSGLQSFLLWAAPVTATSVNTETRSSKTYCSCIEVLQVEMGQLLTLLKTPQPPFPRAIEAHTLLLGSLVITTYTVLFYTMARSKLTKHFLLVGILISCISGSLFAVDIPDFVFRYLFIITNLMLVAGALTHNFQGRDMYQRLEVRVEEVKGEK